MISHGYMPPQSLTPGKIQRFGKKKRNWCILFHDQSAGVFGDWSTGERHYWKRDQRKLTKKERICNYKRISSEKKRRADAERKSKCIAAATAKKNYLASSVAPPDFPYVLKKQIPHDSLRIYRDRLVIPLERIDGELVNLQYIDAYGNKRFHPGAQLKGTFCVLRVVANNEKILICEGIATGLTLGLLDMTATIVAAISCWNLTPVAKNLRQAFPHSRIVIAGDNDRFTVGNPGKTQAIQAALAIGAEYAIPDFPPGVKGTDYNDLVCSGAWK